MGREKQFKNFFRKGAANNGDHKSSRSYGNRTYGEVDYTIDYSGTVPGTKWLGFSAGLINYHFPSGIPETTEFYWGLSMKTPLDLSLTVYHDIDEAEGTYLSGSVGKNYENIFMLNDSTPLGMEVSAELGWGNSDYNKYY